MDLQYTRDPISLQAVTNLDTAPCVYEGDGDNGIAIYFEYEDDRMFTLRRAKLYI